MKGALGAKILLAALVTLGTLALAEVVLRAVVPAPPEGGLKGLFLTRLDRPWLYGLRPGAEARLPTPDLVNYTINADGFRDRLYPHSKPEGTFRVALLGDSLAMGYGVEQELGFADRIEETLARLAPAARVEVLNFGVGAYNAYNERALLEDVVFDYSPDLVLVQFCINDLSDPTLHFGAATRFVLAEIPDEAFPDPATREPVTAASRLTALCRRSRVCTLASSAWSSVAKPEESKPDAEARRRAFDLHPGAELTTEWRWLEDNYRRMATAAGKRGARFGVLAFPHASQVKRGTDNGPQQLLAQLGESNGWPTVDLLPAFLSAARTKADPLFEDWWHPTVEGHRVAADAILAKLTCLDLLPEAASALCATGRR